MSKGKMEGVRFGRDQLAEIRTEAERQGLTLSAFIRNAAISRALASIAQREPERFERALRAIEAEGVVSVEALVAELAKGASLDPPGEREQRS